MICIVVRLKDGVIKVNTVCRQLALGQIERAQVRLASDVNVARTAPSEVQKLDEFECRGNFGSKQSPRNTILSPPSRSDLPLCK